MLARCHKPHTPGYSSYGGRGISVCDEWRDPVTGLAAFISWIEENLGLRPEGKTGDRACCLVAGPVA